MPLATQALAGSNSDVVANRRAIRMANMSAAEMLKAELSGHPVPPKPDLSLPPKPSILPDPDSAFIPKSSLLEASQMSRDSRIAANTITGTGSRSSLSDDQMDDTSTAADKENDMVSNEGVPPASAVADAAENARGVKRKFDETEEDAVDSSSVDEEAVPAATTPALKVNPDGTVEQEDTVKCVVLVSSRDYVVDRRGQIVGTWLQGTVLSPEIWCGAQRYRVSKKVRVFLFVRVRTRSLLAA